ATCAREYLTTIGGKGNCIDRVGVSLELLQLPARGDIPEARGFITTRGHYLPPIGGKGDPSDIRRMARKFAQLLASRHIPQTSRFIVASRQHLPAVRRKSNRPNPIGV